MFSVRVFPSLVAYLLGRIIDIRLILAAQILGIGDFINDRRTADRPSRVGLNNRAVGRGAIDFESREIELETWKNGVDRFLSSREERSRTDRSGRGGRNRYRGKIQTSRDSCYPLLLGEKKKRKKNTRYLKDASYRGRNARRIRLVLDQLFDRRTRRGGGRCRETRTTENGGEERKDTSDASVDWRGWIVREREDKGYTHTHMYTYIRIESFRSRRSAQRGVLSAKFRLEEPKVSLHGPGGSFLQLKNRMDWFQPRTFRKF